MSLPVVARTPSNYSITAAMSGDRTETVTAGETAIVIVAVASGGAGVSVTGGGDNATWTQIRNDSDGTRRTIIFRGSALSTNSQTVTLSFTGTTTCRWSWVAVTGISTVAPDDSSDTKTTTGTRTSTDAATSLTTENNVLAVLVMATASNISTIAVPTGFTRISAANGVPWVLGYGALSTGLTASAVTVTHGSTSTSAIGSAASFNGDDPATTNPRHLLTLGAG